MTRYIQIVMYVQRVFFSRMFVPKLSHMIGIIAVLMFGLLFVVGYVDLKLDTKFAQENLFLWDMHNLAPFVAILAGIVFLVEHRPKNKKDTGTQL